VTSSMLVILAIWFVALFLGPALWLAMSLAGIAFILINGIAPVAIPQKIAMAANSFPLLAAPIFILMGNVMNRGGVTQRIFAFTTALVGWLRGGLAYANILASIIFAGMSGSAVAEAGGLGTIEVKAMRDAGYDPAFAAGLTGAAATIGPIIPPSLPMIIYGVSAETSIGALFIAGVVPGLLMGASLAMLAYRYARAANLPRLPFPGAAEVWAAFRAAFFALMTPVILFGGMMSGIFTATEAAAVAAVYALLLGLVIYRDFDLRELPALILETVETSGVVMALVMAAQLLGYCLSISRMPQAFGAALSEITTNPLIYLFIVNALLLVVGCFMEAIAAMLILIPILVPPALKLGIDPVQFGLVFVLNLMIGTLTPPVGVVLFVMSRIAQVPFAAVARATAPFLVPLIFVLMAITLWPPLTTGLPGLLMAR
jgi:tripartite ATP-independent transporter DctM subunit